MARDFKLDRIVTIGIEGPETRIDGRPIQGEIVDTDMWCRQRDARLDIDRGDRTQLRTVRTYRVRYTDPLVNAFSGNRLSVVVEGERYQVESVIEIERRRWLDLRVFLDVS